MNGKIKVTQHKMNKVLDYISTYSCNNKGIVFIDKSFYAGISNMNQTEINQILNALEDDNVIIKHPPSIHYPCPTLHLTANAFTYRMKQKRNRFRFWFPVIISILALLVALLSLTVDVVQLTQNNPEPNPQQQNHQSNSQANTGDNNR